jgi:hypothetical protein
MNNSKIESLVRDFALSGDIAEYKAFLNDLFLSYMENVEGDSEDRKDKVHKYRELTDLLKSFNHELGVT